MRFTSTRRVRRGVAVAAISAYALPIVAVAVAGAAHGASHLVDRIEAEQQRAVALGLTHQPPRELSHAEVVSGVLHAVESERLAESAAGLVHSHGGSTHGHTSGLGLALEASTHAGGGDAGSPEAPPSLTMHVPGRLATLRMATPPAMLLDASESFPPSALETLPPTPPPRA